MIDPKSETEGELRAQLAEADRAVLVNMKAIQAVNDELGLVSQKAHVLNGQLHALTIERRQIEQLRVELHARIAALG